MGYNVMGYSFVGVESFLTVPGLRLWLDSRRMRTIEDDKVIRWSSLFDNKLFTAIEEQRPGYTDPWIDFDDLTDAAGLQLRSATTPEFNFLHNGSPFGYFELMGYVHGDTGSPISTRIFTTRQGMGTGANVNIQNMGDRLVYQVVEEGNLLVGAQTGVSTLPQGQVNTLSVTRNSFTESNNLKLYTNNILRTQTTTSAAAEGDCNSCTMGNVRNKRYLVGIKLLYDWTGFTSSEVEVFSEQVRNLLEQEKPNFEYPS